MIWLVSGVIALLLIVVWRWREEGERLDQVLEEFDCEHPEGQ